MVVCEGVMGGVWGVGDGVVGGEGWERWVGVGWGLGGSSRVGEGRGGGEVGGGGVVWGGGAWAVRGWVEGGGGVWS